tara:strand:- start:1257 stop:1559 length:303 start_codon:yes stop_codon:yes gene_type:complete
MYNFDNIDEDINKKDLNKYLINIEKSITNLNLDEKTEIFKIIKNNSEKYSNNKNGIFVNLSKLNISTINEIINKLNYYNNNKKTLLQDESKIDEYKTYLN